MGDKEGEYVDLMVPLQRVSNDIFINSSLYKNRWLTTEEQVELLSADLRLTRRLGFPQASTKKRTKQNS